MTTKTKSKEPLQLEHKGSLITIAGSNQCLGYLMNFDGHGVYDAEHGRVEVTPAEADTHNKLLSVALLQGLDENCQIGQGGTFYFSRNPNKVTTWTGGTVSENVHLTPGGKGITFIRNAKQFRGRLSQVASCFNFVRIS